MSPIFDILHCSNDYLYFTSLQKLPFVAHKLSAKYLLQCRTILVTSCTLGFAAYIDTLDELQASFIVVGCGLTTRQGLVRQETNCIVQKLLTHICACGTEVNAKCRNTQ